jgi:uncharacterized protein involved in cysteine biosynthesis
MGFFRGFSAPFRAFAFLRRERLMHFTILPILINVALAVGAAWAAALYWKQELAQRTLGSPALASVLLVVTTMLGAIVLFVIFQPVLGAVFTDVLSEQSEKRIVGQVPPVPFFASTTRALGHGILKFVLYTVALLVGLTVALTTAGMGGAIGVGLGAIFLAYDGFDYPLTRRGVGFGAKWRYLALHPMQTIGYGLGCTVLYLVPLALVVAPPLMAVGATMVYLETENNRSNKKGKSR